MNRVFLAFVVLACLCLGLSRIPVHAQSTALVQGVTVAFTTNTSGGAYPTAVAAVWPVNFADDAVAVSCTVQDENSPFYSASLFVKNIRSVSASGVTGEVYTGKAGSSANNVAGTLHCVGVHN